MGTYTSKHVLLVLLFTSPLCWGWGCAKEDKANPAPATGPQTPTAKQASATASPSPPNEAAKPAAADNQAATKQQDPAQEAKADSPATPVEAVLREFFQLLANKKLDKAQELMVLKKSDCTSFMLEAAGCENLIKGQKEGLESLTQDPVPFNSKILDLVVGSEIKTDAKRGFSLELSLWAGNAVRARSPDGHVFVMKSLAVLETPAGLRVMWGKMRSGPDSLRNPKKAAKTP